MSSNLCPRCHKPIRIPEEEVIVVRTKIGKGKTEDRMVHKVCPSNEPVAQVGGQQYCTNCGHAKSIHSPGVHIQASTIAASARTSAGKPDEPSRRKWS